MTAMSVVAENAEPSRGEPTAVMALLERGIPLTLLMDLLDPFGPRSEEILRTEGTDAA
ncbi:MAG TPA: hypothetical protein VGN19_01950 [Pedococcus sp.]|nr:hypothetical protein [Pedococcus sp.]